MSDYSFTEALSNAAKIKPTRNEAAEAFSKRIVQVLAADDFPEDDWEALPDEAQQWVNEQIRATNERKEISPVPGYDEFYEHNYTPTRRFKSVMESTSTEPEQENEPAPLNVFDEEEAAPKPKAVRAKKAPKANGDGRPNAIFRIREMLLDDFSLTPNEILERLKTEGYRELSRLTATSVKADFRTTLKFLQDKHLMVREIVTPTA
jgi:predicted metal-dependent hydrolase